MYNVVTEVVTLVKSVGMRELKTKLSEIVREVRKTREDVAITIRGEEIARIVPSHHRMTPQEIQRWMDETEELARRVGKHWPEGVSAVDAVREQRRDL